MTTLPSRRALRVAAALATAALLLTACADDSDDPDDAGSPGATATVTTTVDASSDTAHNDADASFATEMIPHHQQALAMVAMTEGRTLDPAFARLTAAIEAAQTPEIALMSGWLEDWGLEVPNADSTMMGSGHHLGSGMMGEEDLSRLRGAGPGAFEAMWLRMMIAHHEGAVAMAQAEQADGQYPAALDLAASIATSQAEEIGTMKAMLAG